MQPGSFIDLLMRAKDKTTGQGFTDLEIANQVTLLSHPHELNFHRIPVPACRQSLGTLVLLLLHRAYTCSSTPL